MLYDRTKVAERLGDLRQSLSKTYTYKELSKSIEDKTGVYISHTSLNDYENQDKDVKMSAQNVIALAEFYGVSCDFILGVGPKHRKNYNIVEETGLSEKAVEVLKNWRDTTGESDWDKLSGFDKHKDDPEWDIPRQINRMFRHFPDMKFGSLSKGKTWLENKVTKAPPELSALIEHPYLRAVTDLICALKYLAGDKDRLENRDAVMGAREVDSLIETLTTNNAREYIVFRLQNVFLKMINDLVPHIPTERESTQAQVDDYYYRKGE